MSKRLTLILTKTKKVEGDRDIHQKIRMILSSDSTTAKRPKGSGEITLNIRQYPPGITNPSNCYSNALLQCLFKKCFSDILNVLNDCHPAHYNYSCSLTGMYACTVLTLDTERYLSTRTR